jgi:hypothetical protein
MITSYKLDMNIAENGNIEIYSVVLFKIELNMINYFIYHTVLHKKEIEIRGFFFRGNINSVQKNNFHLDSLFVDI